MLFIAFLSFGSVALSQNVGGMSGPCSAFAIPSPYTTPVTLLGATTAASSAFSSTCYSNDQGPVVWYTITPTAGTNVTITTCNPGTNFDTVISVYTGTCHILSCLLYNDDAYCNSTNSLSTVSFLPAANTIYYIAVGGYSTSKGNFHANFNYYFSF